MSDQSMRDGLSEVSTEKREDGHSFENFRNFRDETDRVDREVGVELDTRTVTCGQCGRRSRRTSGEKKDRVPGRVDLTGRRG